MSFNIVNEIESSVPYLEIMFMVILLIRVLSHPYIKDISEIKF